MDKVEIVLPVSRTDFLRQVFTSLEMLECNLPTTSLLVYVDGNQTLLSEAQRYVDQSKFQERRCIPRSASKEKPSKTDVMARRKRIADIHNELKSLVGDCKYIFGVEDDTLVPKHALKTLLRDYSYNPFAGFIEGVELGRWGVPYVGAWRCDNVYEPTQIKTVERGTGVQEIDAGGFYCFLTRQDWYTKHEFKPYGRLLGPDVEYGLSLRQEGIKNYIDWSVSCRHLRADGSELTLGKSPVYRFGMTKAMVGKREIWKQHITEEATE